MARKAAKLNRRPRTATYARKHVCPPEGACPVIGTQDDSPQIRHKGTRNVGPNAPGNDPYVTEWKPWTPPTESL